MSPLATRWRAISSRPASWRIFVLLLSILPVCGLFLPGRVFYVRDLSLFFWGRHLFIRRSLLSGQLPLWDPYLAAGQSVVADALNQLFLLPVVLLRLLGSEIVGFNLWVALPFPLAAAGAFQFLRHRFSSASAALGAVFFAICGPVISTGNCPNLSWSIAAAPWVLWAVDRCLARGAARDVGVLALIFGGQALAGEPVTMVATGVLSLAYAAVNDSHPADTPVGRRAARWALVLAGFTLGGLLSAIQMLPLAAAVNDSWRPFGGTSNDFWSMHPWTLLETVHYQLFGDYLKADALPQVPWMAALNSEREPFFHSIYFGVPALTVALWGLLVEPNRRWARFWGTVIVVAVFFAFGAYSPVYPFVRDFVPVLSSFRFPVKYLLIATLALAALVASGWERLSAGSAPDAVDGRWWGRRGVVVAFPALIGVAAYAVSALTIYATTAAAFQIYRVAEHLGIQDPIGAAEFMLKALPQGTTVLVTLAALVCGLMAVSTSVRREASWARGGLFVLVALDLLVRAWPINPTFPSFRFEEPRWIGRVAADPMTRFYIGGKLDGTLGATDPDGSHGFVKSPGLDGGQSRAALSIEAAFSPSPWRARELFSTDLAVLWPRPFRLVQQRFLLSNADDRLRFLDANAIRFRVLSPETGEGHTPLARLPFFLNSSLYDWGTSQRRVGMKAHSRVVPDVQQRIDAWFQSMGRDPDGVLLEHDLPAEGQAGQPVEPFARLVSDENNRVVVNCGAGAGGGFLLLLDAYSRDWKVTVDGRDATMGSGNVLYRAVHLQPGRHVVEFRYRPDSLLYGGLLSLGALVGVVVLLSRRRGASPSRAA